MQRPVFLVLVNIPEEDWSYRIDERRKRVGRSQEAEIRIPPRYASISRHHAEMWRDAGGIWLKDTASRGGTWVNGLCLKKRQAVRITIDDRIALSDVEFKLVDDLSTLAELMVEANIAVSLAENANARETTFDHNLQHADEVRSQLGWLSPAELEVVLWMYRGYTNDAELGRVLFRSPHTIRTQIASIFSKLGVHSRADIVTWLKRFCIARPDEPRWRAPDTQEVELVPPRKKVRP